MVPELMKEFLQVGWQQWSAWRERSVSTKIVGAMVTVGGFATLVKLASVIKDVVIAQQFGTGDALDAFLIAYVLPAFAINLAGGSFNAALIPTYVQVKERQGQTAAQELLSSVMVLTTLVLGGVVAMLALTAPLIIPLMASGFDHEKIVMARALYYVLLPMIILSGLATIWGAVLNAHHRFALVAMAPISTAIFTVLLVLGFGERWGGYAIAGGTLAGSCVETALLGWGLSRRGLALFPRWHGTTPAVRQVFDQYVPMIAGALLVGGATIVGQSMAAMLDAGSVSALSYGSKVTNLVLGIGALAVSTAVLPHFSRMVARGEWIDLRHVLVKFMKLLLSVFLPVTAVLILLSKPAVVLLFQRGAFTEADSQIVSRVQAMYLLQIPPYVVIMLLVRLISAFQANHLLMWSAFITFCGTVGFTYLFMQWWKVVGIALATSLSHLLASVFLAYVALRLINERGVRGVEAGHVPQSFV